MAEKKKTYRELKAELDTLMVWFERDDIDIEEALKKYQQAEKLISEIEALLSSAALTVKKL